VSIRDDRQIPLPEPVEREDDDDFAPTRRLVRNFAALLAVGGLVAIVWYAYHQIGGGGAGDGTVPVIHAEAGPIKEKVDPAGGGGIDVPFRDRKVYGLMEDGHEGAVKKSEAVPAKRAPESGGDGESEDDDATKAADTKPSGAKTADAKPADKTTDAKTADAKPVDKATDTKTAEDAKQVAAVPPSGFRVQLAAVSSVDDATRQWQRIQSKNMDILGNLKLMVEKIDVPAKKQTLYRIQAGPFKSEADAKDICAKLAARKVSCFFVKS
jgi:cell division septation protein DedD